MFRSSSPVPFRPIVHSTRCRGPTTQGPSTPRPQLRRNGRHLTPSYSAQCVEECSLLKNSIALPTDPASGAGCAVLALFWSCSRPLLGCRQGRRAVFQRAGFFSELRMQDLVCTAPQRRKDGSQEPACGVDGIYILRSCLKM